MSLALFVSDYPGTIDDATRQWLLAVGASGGTINDMWMQFLTAQGFLTGTRNDRTRAFLLGYLGVADVGQTLNDLWGSITGPYVA